MAKKLLTYATVKTVRPPKFDQEIALVVVDPLKTFLNLKENSGAKAELPIPGSMDKVPAVRALAALTSQLGILTVTLWDTHVRGKNPTLMSSFNGITERTWITLEVAKTWLEPGKSPIKVDAGFTAEQYVAWLEMNPFNGAMIWEDHAYQESPLYGIEPSIYSEILKNPNRQIITKGSQPSVKIPNFIPESYSGFRLSTDESLGVTELLTARGVKKLITIGFDGNFCEGETSIDGANAGFEVYSVVDAISSLVIPNFADTGMTSEELMVQRKMGAGVKFCTTADIFAANGFKFAA